MLLLHFQPLLHSLKSANMPLSQPSASKNGKQLRSLHFQLFGHQGETDGLSGRKENMCHKCLHHDFCHSKGFKDRATWPGVLQLAILQSPETWQECQAIAAWAAGTLAANLARPRVEFCEICSNALVPVPALKTRNHSQQKWYISNLSTFG